MALRIIWGTVDSNGTPKSISNRTVTVRKGGTGTYTLDFGGPFSAVPSVVATALDANASKYVVAMLTSVSTSACTITISDANNGKRIDSSFCFQVAGG